jgi:hypothetical protein
VKVRAKPQPGAPELLLAACPKCGCVRTRSVSTMLKVYYRCDACEYVFCPRGDAPPSARRECSKCGSQRTHVIGQSASLSLVHAQCDECGYISSLSGPPEPRPS